MKNETYAEGKLSPKLEFVSSEPMRFKSFDDLLLKNNIKLTISNKKRNFWFLELTYLIVRIVVVFSQSGLFGCFGAGAGGGHSLYFLTFLNVTIKPYPYGQSKY